MQTLKISLPRKQSDILDFSVKPLAEEKRAYFTKVAIHGTQLDGEDKGFEVYPKGDIPKAIAGDDCLHIFADNIKWHNVDLDNAFVRLKDDTGKWIRNLVYEPEPNTTYWFAETWFDMPDRDYTLTAQIGHFEEGVEVIDDEIVFTVKLLPEVSPFPWEVILAGAGIFLAVALVFKK